MKAIFVGHLRCPGSSGHQRLWALRQCGVEVEALDKDRFKKKMGRAGHLFSKLLRNPSMTHQGPALEKEILALCQRIQPDLLWMEWAKEFSPAFFSKLKSMEKVPKLVSFQDDNPWGSRVGDRWMWRDYFRAVPEFDLHLVKRAEDEIHLARMGAKKCHRWDHGVYPPFFHPGEAEE